MAEGGEDDVDLVRGALAAPLGVAGDGERKGGRIAGRDDRRAQGGGRMVEPGDGARPHRLAMSRPSCGSPWLRRKARTDAAA
jgi:hypothetical protein